MSVRWERLAGDTARFAMKLAFAADPHGGLGAEPELADSWGAIQLWVEGVNVCAHVDSGETLEASHWYLLPFLEWLAQEWNAVFHEEHLPVPGCSDDAASLVLPWADLGPWRSSAEMESSAQRHWDWRARHAIRSARDGGVLPDMFFRPYRDTVEISWADAPLPGAEDVRFLAPLGRGRLEPALVADAMHEVALDAARWLASHAPESTRLAALVARLEQLPHSEREQRIAWLAGLGEEHASALSRWRQLVDDVSSRWSRDAVVGTFEPDFSASGLVVQGSAAAGLLFGSAAPTLADADVRSLVELLLARFATSTSSPLDDYVRDEPPRFRHPAWEHGYELAVEVLDELFDGAQDHIDIEWGLARFGVEVVEVGLSDTELRAVSFAGPHHAPTVAVNMSCSHGEPPTARRFTLAHELCHLLFDRDKAADLAIASGPWAPRDLERRANAFAAMLLMPPWLIRQAESTVGDPVGSPEGAAKVAEVLGVSHSALVWHTFNLGIVDTPPRNLLRPDLADQG